MHDTEFCGDAYPAPHGVHAVAPVGTPVALPAAQFAHAVDASLAAYVPAAHEPHVAEDVAPAAALADPVGHARHEPRSGDT